MDLTNSLISYKRNNPTRNIENQQNTGYQILTTHNIIIDNRKQ